jgi:tetratricopeptide (TPR) repeat protein
MKPLFSACIAAVIVSFAFGQAGHGRGRLTGFVIDEEGVPIALARVILRFLEFEETRGREFTAPKFTIREPAVIKTVTDKKGRWYFNGLAGGTWEVNASGKGYVSAIHTCRVRELSENPVIRLRLEKMKEGYYILAPEILEKANEFFWLGEFEKALALYLNYLEKDPGAVMVVLVVGDCWRHVGDTMKAIEAYQTVVEKISGDPIHKDILARAFAGIAECYYDDGDKENALKYLQLSVQTSQSSDLVAATLGDLLFMMGRTEEAIKSYLIAIQIAPNRGLLQYRLGLVYLNKGDYEHAKACFIKVLDLEPGSELATQAQIILNDLSKRKEEIC